MIKLTRGILISVEGIDGSGKSTLANNLKKRLEENRFPVNLTYEPGDTNFGKQLREILQTRKHKICGKSEFLLFASDRAQHFEDVIIPNLEERKIVLSDRMADSSIAYQGYGRGVDIPMIKKINQWAMQNISPDLTLYIKVSSELAIGRLKKRKGRPTSFEKEKEQFTKKLVRGFDEIFKGQTNVVTLDGEQPAQMLTKIAYANITQWLKKNDILL